MSDKNVLLTLGDFRLRALSDGFNIVLEEWKEAEADPEAKGTGRKKDDWVFLGYYGRGNLKPALAALTSRTLEAQPFLQSYEGFQQQLTKMAEELEKRLAQG